MSEPRQRMTKAQFFQRLDTLRSKIDTVPEQFRATLRAAADKAQEQYERRRRICAQIDDMVADLGLIVEHTKFHLAACRRELRPVYREGNRRV